MDKYNKFLDEYYQRVKKEIIDEYDEKLEIAKEESELTKTLSQIDDFIGKEIELSIDISPFIEDKNGKLFIKTESVYVVNEKEEVVGLSYSQKDKDSFMIIADKKKKKLDKLNEVISDIKLLVATVGNEQDFKDLLTTYGIIDEMSGRLK